MAESNTISDVGTLVSLVLVGAFWGCTNPLLRRGSVEEPEPTTPEQQHPPTGHDKNPNTILRALRKFRKVQVWLPYALNQCGSLLFYFLLNSSDLSTAVPICNSLALVFSLATSYILGEQVDKPFRAFLGATLVLVGVSICVQERRRLDGENGSI